MPWVALVVVSIAAAVGFALRLPKTFELQLWAGMAGPYFLLAGLGGWRLQRKGRLRPLLQFRRGDPTLGILLGFLLLGAAWLAAKVLAPAGAAERAWLLRVFLVVGDTSEVGVSLVILLLVLSEELVWRGWVQGELRDRVGPRRAWIGAALLYAVAHLPTLVTLADPAAGKNPLVVLAALGAGLCFGFIAERTGRLSPGFFAHLVFSYFAAQSFWLFV